MEKEVEVKTVKVVYLCDKCEVEVKSSGFNYACNPPIYPHYCPSCQEVFKLRKVYPYIVHIEVAN